MTTIITASTASNVTDVAVPALSLSAAQAVKMAATLDSIDLANAEPTPGLFLLATACRRHDEAFRLILSKVAAKNWALLIDWLNADDTQDKAKLIQWVKSNVQSNVGRYASKTHTIKLAGETWAYLNRPQDDILKAERKELVEKLTKNNVVVAKDAPVKALKEAVFATQLIADNKSLLELAAVKTPTLTANANTEEVAAFATSVKEIVRHAKAQVGKINELKKDVKKGLEKLDAKHLDSVNPELAKTLHAMPLSTPAEVEKASSLIKAAEHAVKLKVTVPTVAELEKKVEKELTTRAFAAPKTEAVNHTLKFDLTKADRELSLPLRSSITTIANEWMRKHDTLTSASVELVTAKVLYELALQFEALAAKPVQTKDVASK